MEMDELKAAWGALGERLQRQGVALRQLRDARALDGLRARLRLFTAGQVAQLVIGSLIVLWAGGYWWRHLDEPHLVAYGVAIHLYGLALLIVAAAQLTRVLQIDYQQPLLEVQRRLLALRRLRVASERALLLVGCVIWVPFLFVALRAIRIDVWVSRPAVVLGNLAFGIMLALVLAVLMRRYRERFERDAVGRSLHEAEAELAQWLRHDDDD